MRAMLLLFALASVGFGYWVFSSVRSGVVTIRFVGTVRRRVSPDWFWFGVGINALVAFTSVVCIVLILTGHAS